MSVAPNRHSSESRSPEMISSPGEKPVAINFLLGMQLMGGTIASTSVSSSEKRIFLSIELRQRKSRLSQAFTVLQQKMKAAKLQDVMKRHEMQMTKVPITSYFMRFA